VSLFAVSLHEKAGNIPPSTTWYGGWRLRRAFALAPAEAPDADADAKRIANRVRSVGYYVWREGLC
jgi:hypothetical protein